MPDNGSSPNTAENGTSVDLESLVAEAEAQASTPVNDHPKPCEHAIDAKTHKCPTCLWSFCDDCASSLDPRYCKLCLNEPDAALLDLPLVDADGVTHSGRILTPAPTARYFSPRLDLPGNTLLKTITEMSESELESYVSQYKDLVHQAERALDFRRVVLGSSQLELSQRKEANARKLRSDKTKFPVKTVTLDVKTGKQVTKTEPTARVKQMLQAIEMLRKLKESKDAKKVQP